jgi:hypothetical protein
MIFPPSAGILIEVEQKTQPSDRPGADRAVQPHAIIFFEPGSGTMEFGKDPPVLRLLFSKTAGISGK